jgi:hypothetical protein
MLGSVHMPSVLTTLTLFRAPPRPFQALKRKLFARRTFTPWGSKTPLPMPATVPIKSSPELELEPPMFPLPLNKPAEPVVRRFRLPALSPASRTFLHPYSRPMALIRAYGALSTAGKRPTAWCGATAPVAAARGTRDL